MSLENDHRRLLFRLTLAVKLFFFLVLQAATLLPLFDASPLLVPNTKPGRALLRWDTFHFLHIAEHGYVYEHEWAFTGSRAYLLVGGMMVALACDNSQTLYSLSLHHLRSPELALLASLLSLIPTSPVTLYFAPYNEPCFTHFSYRGMLCCTRREWFKASLWFALAGTFRSNGIFLSGFILWGLLVQPFLARQMPTIKAILKSMALTTVVVTPFVAYQAYAYFVFCSSQREPLPEWCSRIPPSIYTHVQAKYWDVGFMRYWTLSQIPNFLIAAPTLMVIFAFSFYHLKRTTALKLSNEKDRSPLELAFENASITPHAIHATIFTSILLFASHTQIVLRLAASMPLVYWAAAWLLTQHPALGRLWVTWSVLWGVISTILWATFLPPA
ncbi:glycosyltransferase family 76 protein [Flammula alnicola]|nr:glycosyltransferase family 76 protein [Flammula alnicola]